MNFIIEVADKVLNGGEVTRAEAERLINVSDDDTMLLLAMADKIRQTGSGQQQPQFRPEFPDPAAGKKFGNMQIKRKVGLIPDRQNIMMPEPDGKQQAQPERQKQRIQHITPENPAAA